MEKLLLNFKAVPRWIILLIDLCINGFSFVLSYFIAKHFQFPEILRGHFFIYTGSYCLVAGMVFYLMRVHTCLIRYSNIHDMLRIFLSVFITSVVYPVVIQLAVTDYFNIYTLNIGAVLFINFFIASTLLVMLRMGVKETYNYVKHISAIDFERILIYGSGNNAILLKQTIESSDINKFIIAGFIATSASKVNTYIQQKKVYGIKDLAVLKNKKNVDNLILINEQPPGVDKKIIIEKCLQLGIKVLTVPSPDQWIYGKLNLKQIQELKIEDLLQREPIVISNHKICNEISGKRVLVTGAAGSIGSEIVRQVLSYNPEMVILCDQAETLLYDVQLELEERYPDATLKVFIASIRDYNRMQLLFQEYSPEIVFHAAAYKHVPMMERHPAEAVLTNIMGTKNIADLSILFKVSKFVMVSTDKAVNPTNIMGTSKRIAEMYAQSLRAGDNTLNEIYGIINSGNGHNENLKTKFITTRFGNVLNSNGSVIPRFREQIQNGGPVTVTDPEITRFFMTIPESVQLVLEACTMGTGGEIFVFDMGKPIKIVDLAKKMIQISGLTPEVDIKIIYTGLRPGEKLYEELLNHEEKTLPTHHEKIKIAKVIPCSRRVRWNIEQLIKMSIEDDDSDKLVKKMKELVPEFKSKNSQYEKLDVIVTTTPSKIVSR
ncbi:MAG: nucleoside-diphosphate sugar epimerase/dehydratase [Ginsengibacter sp.]